jgi:hypothetical protein
MERNSRAPTKMTRPRLWMLSMSRAGFGLDLDYLGMQTHDLSELELPFSEEEVWEVIRSQELDKSLGPDGFTGTFYTA